MTRNLRATVSGSFRRAMTAVQDAVYELTDAGVTVLSPADPRVVDQFGDFLFVASDAHRTVKLVEDRHLAAIRAADFVWLVAPDGYVGLSASLELGLAIATRTPVYSSDVPSDLTLRQYVSVVADLPAAIAAATRRPSANGGGDVLLAPQAEIDAAHAELETIGRVLRGTESGDGRTAELAAARVCTALASLR